MLRWWSLAASIALFLLLMFFAASAAGIAVLEDPTPWFRGARATAAVIGVSLLVADVFLPVPSSLVMVAHGTLFGVVGGAVLSLVGSIASALVGFAVGRAGSGAIRKVVSEREHERAAAMLARWGVVAIAVTRPVPILAETVAILAGSSRLRWRDAALAAAAGSLVPAFVYSWTGAHVQTAVNHALVFGGVLLVTGILWWVGESAALNRSLPFSGSALNIDGSQFPQPFSRVRSNRNIRSESRNLSEAEPRRRIASGQPLARRRIESELGTSYFRRHPHRHRRGPLRV